MGFLALLDKIAGAIAAAFSFFSKQQDIDYGRIKANQEASQREENIEKEVKKLADSISRSSLDDVDAGMRKWLKPDPADK